MNFICIFHFHCYYVVTWVMVCGSGLVSLSYKYIPPSTQCIESEDNTQMVTEIFGDISSTGKIKNENLHTIKLNAKSIADVGKW